MKNYSQNNEQEIILNFLEKNNLTEGKLLENGCKLISVEQDGYYTQLQQKFLSCGYSVLSLNAENIIMGKSW